MSNCSPNKEFGPYPAQKLKAYRKELTDAQHEDVDSRAGKLGHTTRLSLIIATIDILSRNGTVSPAYVSRAIGRSASTTESYLNEIHGACAAKLKPSAGKYDRR